MCYADASTNLGIESDGGIEGGAGVHGAEIIQSIEYRAGYGMVDVRLKEMHYIMLPMVCWWRITYQSRPTLNLESMSLNFFVLVGDTLGE